MLSEEFMDTIRKEFPKIMWKYKDMPGDLGHYAYSVQKNKTITSYVVKYKEKWSIRYLGVNCLHHDVNNFDDLKKAHIELRDSLFNEIEAIKAEYKNNIETATSDLSLLDGNYES
jgi:hypothetical protein